MTLLNKHKQKIKVLKTNCFEQIQSIKFKTLLISPSTAKETLQSGEISPQI